MSSPIQLSFAHTHSFIRASIHSRIHSLTLHVVHSFILHVVLHVSDSAVEHRCRFHWPTMRACNRPNKSQVHPHNESRHLSRWVCTIDQMWSPKLHCIALHWLHCIALHCFALHWLYAGMQWRRALQEDTGGSPMTDHSKRAPTLVDSGKWRAAFHCTPSLARVRKKAVRRCAEAAPTLARGQVPAEGGTSLGKRQLWPGTRTPFGS